jgi:hypothetical protein
MMWRALIILCLFALTGVFAGDEIFERDLSTPLLRDDDDRFLRDRDLPGPLRQSWPYADKPEGPFPAVEARRACHARTLFEIGKAGGAETKAVARLQSERDGVLRYVVTGRYEAEFDGARKVLKLRCVVSSRAVAVFTLLPTE